MPSESIKTVILFRGLVSIIIPVLISAPEIKSHLLCTLFRAEQWLHLSANKASHGSTVWGSFTETATRDKYLFQQTVREEVQTPLLELLILSDLAFPVRYCAVVYNHSWPPALFISLFLIVIVWKTDGLIRNTESMRLGFCYAEGKCLRGLWSTLAKVPFLC